MMQPILRFLSISTVFLLILSIASLVAPSADAATIAVKGRAYALYVDTPTKGVSSQFYCNTGWLPPTGGALGETVTSLSVADVFSIGTMSVTSEGDECKGESSVSIGNAVILPGHAAEITFDSFSESDDDTCCEHHDVPEAVQISNLTFGGAPVTVTGALNQVETLPGVGTLYINEVVVLSPDDCDDDDFEVLGLHLVLDTGEEIVVGGSIFHSEDECCPLPTQETSWGQIKSGYQ